MLDLFGIPALWDQVVAFFTLSPFWEYLLWGVAICIGALLLGWLFPVLRSLSGAVIVAIVGMLYAYRRGENDAAKRHAERQRKQQRREQQRQQNDPWGWWR